MVRREEDHNVLGLRREPMGYSMLSVANALRRSSALLHASVAAAVIMCAATVFPAYAQVTDTVLYSFLGSSDGGIVYAPVLADQSDGALLALYGTTGYGGQPNANCYLNSCGTVFKLTPPEAGQVPWNESVLASFSGGSDGDLPLAGLFARKEPISRNTSLYGTTSGLSGGPGAVFEVTGHNLTTVWTFTGGDDGSFPQAPLIVDEAVDATGALYGTAGAGGSKGCGTVYKLTPPKAGQTAWSEQTLWGFLGSSDGCFPGSPLIADERGALYGTAYAGGASNNGVVFRLTPPKDGETAWSEQILWSFTGGSDGGNPFMSGVIADEWGALYGTTGGGGIQNNGVVFKLTPPKYGQTAWSEQTLWTFTGGSDGGFPAVGLIADRTGALYGTTALGGSNNNVCFGTNGVVFKLTPPKHGQTAWRDTTLWTFSGGADGCFPVAPLIADEKGAIYGTTQYGGSYPPIGGALCTGDGCGVVFRLTGTGFVPGRPGSLQ
jgi:uncharacterized repeat protein (TIGR03803 family)